MPSAAGICRGDCMGTPPLVMRRVNRFQARSTFLVCLPAILYIDDKINDKINAYVCYML